MMERKQVIDRKSRLYCAIRKQQFRDIMFFLTVYLCLVVSCFALFLFFSLFDRDVLNLCKRR